MPPEMTDSQSESRKQEEKLAWTRAGSVRFHNSRASGMTIDLWSALWASGVGGVAGSKRSGVRGHRAEGWWGRRAQLQGSGLNLARAGRLINIERVSTDRKGSVTGQLSDQTSSVRI